MPRGRFGAPRDPATGRFIAAIDAGRVIPETREVTLAQFARELFEKSGITMNRVKTVCDRSGDAVVNQAKKNVLKTAPIHNAGAYKYIDAETTIRGEEIVVVVGYNTEHRPARLGNLLEFGGGGDPSPAHWDLARALESEEERFYDKMGDMAEGLLESRWGELRET